MVFRISAIQTTHNPREDTMMPVKPRISRLVTSEAVTSLARDLENYPGITVNLDRDAGTIEATTDDGTCFLRAIEKTSGGPWIATASTDYIELG